MPQISSQTLMANTLTALPRQTHSQAEQKAKFLYDAGPSPQHCSQPVILYSLPSARQTCSTKHRL